MGLVMAAFFYGEAKVTDPMVHSRPQHSTAQHAMAFTSGLLFRLRQHTIIGICPTPRDRFVGQ